MPFFIQAKNKVTNEIRSKEAVHALGIDHDNDPTTPDRMHIHGLTEARRMSKKYAEDLNAAENTTNWEGELFPEHYEDPRALHPTN
jgi:hypothetical protein